MDNPKNIKDKTLPVKKLEQDIVDLKDKLARSLADYSNLEKRVESQRQLISTLTVAAIVNQLLAVLDDFYLANNHLNDSGLKMSIDKFVNVLRAQGVTEIDATNQPFDPQSMDCVDVKDGPPDLVITTVKRGYMLNGQVIRPAQVIVGKENIN